MDNKFLKLKFSVYITMDDDMNHFDVSNELKYTMFMRAYFRNIFEESSFIDLSKWITDEI